MVRQFFLFFSILSVLLPTSAFARGIRAGTDDYLRMKAGRTETQLQTEYITENREPFAAARGTGTIEDPEGDVLTRTGITSPLTLGWIDLISATMEKREQTQEWVLTLRTAEPIPTDIPANLKVNVNLYIDSHTDTQNAQSGTAFGMDSEFGLLYSPAEGWRTKYRWYNAETDFWAIDKETAMQPMFEGNAIRLSIPFSEIPGNEHPAWRAMTIAARGNDTAADMIPTIGFPPPKGESYEGGIIYASIVPDYRLLLVVLGTSVGLAVFLSVVLKYKKRQG